jgi:hypothetical protein
MVMSKMVLNLMVGTLIGLLSTVPGESVRAQDQPGAPQQKLIAATFNVIPDQLYVNGLFLVTVTVKTGSGQPVPGAHVTISLVSAYAGKKVTLRDAAGDIVSEITGDTGTNGKAPLWVRLSSVDVPFPARLFARAEAPGCDPATVQSNEFRVYTEDTYQNY